MSVNKNSKSAKQRSDVRSTAFKCIDCGTLPEFMQKVVFAPLAGLKNKKRKEKQNSY
jgi:hypothetical protein